MLCKPLRPLERYFALELCGAQTRDVRGTSWPCRKVIGEMALGSVVQDPNRGHGGRAAVRELRCGSCPWRSSALCHQPRAVEIARLPSSAQPVKPTRWAQAVPSPCPCFAPDCHEQRWPESPECRGPGAPCVYSLRLHIQSPAGLAVTNNPAFKPTGPEFHFLLHAGKFLVVNFSEAPSEAE